MHETKKLSFSIKDQVFGNELSPGNATLPIIGEFIEQIAAFLRGSRHPDLNEVKTSIQTGSVAVQVEDKTGLLADAYKDYEHLRRSNDLSGIDPSRAKVVEKWQAEVKSYESRAYSLFVPDESTDNIVLITRETEFATKRVLWVEEELYLYGRVYDMGGKIKPNVHIDLETGGSIKIGTNESVLIRDTENRLYKDQLIRIEAKRNIKTGEIKDERLISFEHYNPEFDEDEFQKIVKKAKVAWESVKDPTKWVEELGGNGG